MKKLFLTMALVVAAPVFAQQFPPMERPIFPKVWNFGNSVQLDIWNTNRRAVSCMGRIYMYTAANQQQSEFVSEYVWGMGSVLRTYRLNNPQDRIVSVNHSIFCN